MTISLNYDLFRFNLKNEPGGFECENYYIFFMECPLYNNIRRNLLVILRVYDEIDLNVIVYGNTECSINQNKDIFRAVQVFLIDSNTFG